AEVHGEPGAHPFAGLRVPERDRTALGDAVDRALAADRELHDEDLRPAVLRQQLDELVELHRAGDAGTVLEQLALAVGARPPDPEAARPPPEHRREPHR